MNIFLTLDYELYLGRSTGTPENCLIRPMEALCRITDRFGAKLVVFADAGYLLKLGQLSPTFPELQKEFQTVSGHIRSLADAGHDIQLHLHPQWYNASWDGEKWALDFKHYKLNDLPESPARSYFREAKNHLETLVSKPVQAFRAGGYSIQSFPDYAGLFRENGILLDSSARTGAKVKSEYQEYDYTYLPAVSLYRFDQQLETASENGRLWELPITTISKNAFAYLSVKRKLIREGALQKSYGNGQGIGRAGSKLHQFATLTKKMFTPQIIPASLDGFHAYWLPHIYRQMQNKKATSFTAIGHPKAFTPYSLRCIENFLENISSGARIMTITELLEEAGKKSKNVHF